MKYALSVCIAAICAAWRGPCETADSTVAQVPVAEWTRSWWMPRFEAKRALANGGGYDVVFIGDSITQGWEGGGRKVWQERFEAPGCGALNIGFGGDRVQGALWTCGIGGLLDGYRTGLVSVMIGTNNTSAPPEDVAAGIVKLLGIVRRKQPDARILLHAILPRGAAPNALRAKNDKVNAIIRAHADGRRVFWVDLGDRLTDEAGNIPKNLLYDFLHPTDKGYEIWAEALRPHLVETAK